MFYIRSLLLGLWLILCCIYGLGKAVFRWGDPSLAKDFARTFSSGAQKITGINVEVMGQEYIDSQQPCIYTVNHQSNFDIVTFCSVYPDRTVIIGKKELIWIPLFGLFYLASGNIMIDRSKSEKAKGALVHIVDEIEIRKVSVWVFPEGTRNRSCEGLLPFKKGAFHMAIAAQVPIVPLVSSSIIPVFDWKRRKLSRGKIQVKILPPISTEGLTESDVTNLANEVRKKMLASLSEIHSEAFK